jgi:cytosine/adenosine deaminase-related metal-dependent hydrolase
MTSSAPQIALSPAEAYRLWAATYDHEPNALLALERRVLGPLLPPIDGMDVVDLGCGTGRWLAAFKDSGAGSLTGIDSCPEMLRVAKSKLANAANLLVADCTTAQLPDASADLLLSSFTLSYLEDAAAFFEAVRKLLRPGSSLFLTDIHPGTAATFHWRRGFSCDNQFREIRTFSRSIEVLRSFAENAALEVTRLLEPCFGEEERCIFAANGKDSYFCEIAHLPAIYILELTRPAQPAMDRWSPRRQTQNHSISRISNAQFALGPEIAFRGEMSIARRRIEALRRYRQPLVHCDSEASVDLHGFLVLPGLINAHDHLEFALFPRLGRGGYKNFLEWAEDIHQPGASPVALHRQVPRETRLWWGGLRNLLCGATTVCHHNPYDPAVFSENFPVRVLKSFGWAHSVPLDSEFSQKKRQTPKGRPFFIHLAEGIDQQSADELFQLSRGGALDKDTVIIHGLGLGLQGRMLFLASGAGMVCCPSSNVFLFGKTLAPGDLRAFPRVAIGSDSPLTAQGDLLDEVRFALEALQLAPQDLYRYVTSSAANLLALASGEGQLRPGTVADLIAIRDLGESPAKALSRLSYKDIELVLLAGRVHLASPEMMRRLSPAAGHGLQCLFIEGTERWLRAPIDHLFADAATHLGPEIFLGGKRVRYAYEN